MSHNVFSFQNSIRLKMDSQSSWCATITHRKCLELHDFVPILFLKKSGEDRLQITLVFDCKTYEEPFLKRNIWTPNTQSHGIKKIK